MQTVNYKYNDGIQNYSKHLRGPFEKFVDSPYYFVWELCRGAVTVFFLSTSLGKRCTSYNAPPSSRKRSAGRDHFEISCLWAPFSWLEKSRNRMGRDLDCMADVLMGFHWSIFSKPNTEFNSHLEDVRIAYEGVSKSFRTGHLERENCKWYSSLPLGAVVSPFCEFCRHNPLCCFSTSVYCCRCLFRKTQSGNFWIYLHTIWSKLCCIWCRLWWQVVYLDLLEWHQSRDCIYSGGLFRRHLITITKQLQHRLWVRHESSDVQMFLKETKVNNYVMKTVNGI
jgi:hypothetical protein